MKSGDRACVYCGGSWVQVPLTVDHVISRELQGDNSWRNLVTCCWSCNSVKSSKGVEGLVKYLGIEKNELSRRVWKHVRRNEDKYVASAGDHIDRAWVKWAAHMSLHLRQGLGNHLQVQLTTMGDVSGVPYELLRCPWCTEMCETCLETYLDTYGLGEANCAALASRAFLTPPAEFKTSWIGEQEIYYLEAPTPEVWRHCPIIGDRVEFTRAIAWSTLYFTPDVSIEILIVYHVC